MGVKAICPHRNPRLVILKGTCQKSGHLPGVGYIASGKKFMPLLQLNRPQAHGIEPEISVMVALSS